MLNNNCKKCNEELLVFEDKKKGICMPCLWKEIPLLSDKEREERGDFNVQKDKTK
jgi:hypothetical protein